MGCLIFQHFSFIFFYPFFLNKAYAIKEAIEVGRSRFNFLKGSERYKYELGGIGTPIHNILISKK